MLIVLIVATVIILIVATLKYPPIALGLFLTAGIVKATLVLEYGFFRIVDYTVLCAVLTLMALAYSFIKGGGHLRGIISVPVVVYLLLATILLLGTTYSSAPNYGLQKSTRFATLGLMALLAPVIFAHSLKELKLMLWILLIVGIFISAITIMEPREAVIRPSAEERAGFLEAGGLATAPQIGLASVVAFIFAIMAHTSKPLRIASLIVIPLTIVAVIITGSRGPFIGLGFTCLLAIFICRKGVSKAWLLVIITTVLIGTIIPFIKLPEKRTARIATMWKSSYHMKEAARSRTEMFAWVAARAIKRPILGNGTGAFAVDRGGQDIRYYPHNIFLELLYEQGLIGGAILSLFLLFILIKWIKASRFINLYEMDIGTFQTVHLAGLLFLFMFTQAMKSGDINDNRLMFFCAGLVLAAFNCVHREVEIPRSESELTTDDWQQMEEIGFQDAQVLY